MSPKKIIIIVIPSIAVLIAMFFVSTNELLEFSSHNEESPSPIMILENTDEVLMGIKITPIGCNKTDSGLTESLFQITNTNEKDYGVKVKVSFTENDMVLFEKQVEMKILSGQTVAQNQLSDAVYDNPICVVQIVDLFEI